MMRICSDVPSGGFRMYAKLAPRWLQYISREESVVEDVDVVDVVGVKKLQAVPIFEQACYRVDGALV